MKSLSPSEQKSRFALRVAGCRLNKALIGPEIVHLHINNHCNLRCRYCSNHSPECPHHNAERLDMTLAKFREILRDCLELRVDTILISGDGEPTLHPEFTAMMRLLRKQPINVTLLTNATYPETLRRDIAQTADTVIINLSAPNAAAYKKITGKNLFRRVVANIKFLVACRDSHRRPLSIMISAVHNSLNAALIDELKVLAKTLGVGIVVKPLSVNAFNTKVRLPAAQAATPGHPPPAPCLNGWFNFSAIANGDVSLCCHLSSLKVGNLNAASFKKIWLSKAFNNLRLAAKSGTLQRRHHSCRDCLSPSQYSRIGKLAGIGVPDDR
ncbi:MAG: radical SAM protein [Candidatus Omnitrophica bacterium]|nr:radical SAM protein [Candidatus Omnitrophota bacterium]